MPYDKMVETIIKKCGKKSAEKRLRYASLYWGPRNYSQKSIKEELGQDILFDEWIRIETGRNRWLLNFHDEIQDMSDPQEVMEAIVNCRNWPIYAKLWRKKAPGYVRSPWILLWALVDITVIGGKSENEFEQRMLAEGREVRRSTSAEDAAGVDFWVDGKPIQVKSKGTKAGAKRLGEGKEWA